MGARLQRGGFTSGDIEMSDTECRDCRFLMMPTKGNQWCLLEGQFSSGKLKKGLSYGDCKEWKKILTLEELKNARK